MATLELFRGVGATGVPSFGRTGSAPGGATGFPAPATATGASATGASATGFAVGHTAYPIAAAASSTTAAPTPIHTRFRGGTSGVGPVRFVRLVALSASVSRSRSELPLSVPASPTTTFCSPSSDSHGASAAITAAGVWYRSSGFFASIFATTCASSGGNVRSCAARSGAGFIWCWASFCDVVPRNGGCPVTSAKNVAPRL